MHWKHYLYGLHRLTGLLIGSVIFVVALTGTTLVFQDKLDPLFAPHYYYVSVEKGQPLSLDDMLAILAARHPDSRVRQVYLFHDPKRTVWLRYENPGDLRRNLVLNPYTGEIVRDVSESTRFFYVVTQLHRYLLLGKTGKVITGISCISFIILVISGYIIWWPGRRNVRRLLRIRFRGSKSHIYRSLHTVLGFWAGIFILITASTGLVWAYPSVEKALFFLADGHAKGSITSPRHSVQLQEKQIHFYQRMVDETNRLFSYPGNLRLIFPKQAQNSIRIRKTHLDWFIPNQRSITYFDSQSGQLIASVPYEKLSRGAKLRQLIYPIHIGQWGGMFSRLISLFMGIVSMSLPLTGFLLWFRRRKNKRKFLISSKKQ